MKFKAFIQEEQELIEFLREALIDEKKEFKRIDTDGQWSEIRKSAIKKHSKAILDYLYSEQNIFSKILNKLKKKKLDIKDVANMYAKDWKFREKLAKKFSFLNKLEKEHDRIERMIKTDLQAFVA